ncbi:MAG: VWA domain-containing protein [Myxococcales bacterium]|nr:VWA domain-containing protein [Myxococcales bacterium]
MRGGVRASAAVLAAASALAGAGLGGAALLPGCTDADLLPIPPVKPFIDDKLAIEGDLCTRSPESLVFPLRVLFVVDASESMRVTDPADPLTGETRRETAVREAWEKLLAAGISDVRVGILRFSAEAQSRTPVDTDGDGLTDSYFSADPAQLGVATAALGVTDRTTNYVAALSEAYFELRTELAGADLESLPLSRYVVVFVSDGLPDVDPTDAAPGGLDTVLDGVSQLRELAKLFRVGDFQFHTVYLSAGQGLALDKPAQDLLETMADLGGGNYRSVPNGEEIDFLGVDFSVIRRVFTLKTLAAVNLDTIVDSEQQAALTAASDALERALDPDQVRAGFVDIDGDGHLSCGEPLVDSDGDGLSDLVEAVVGSDPLRQDTDDDGLSDRDEWDLQGSHDLLDGSDSGCYVPSPCLLDDQDLCACLVDSDADGVCDCAEDASGACQGPGGRDCVDADEDGLCDCPDADADGFCDYADRDGDLLRDCEEIYRGTAQNGADSDADGVPDLLEVRLRTSAVEPDTARDLDFDQTPNGDEVLGGTDPLCGDAAFRSRTAIRYTLEERGLVGDTTCYHLGVHNITLASTLENPTPAARERDGDAAEPFVDRTGLLGNGLNRVLVFAGEVAFDDPQAFARFRVACVAVRYREPGAYKNPPSGKVTLVDSDFVDVRDFDIARDCVTP